MDSTWLPLGCTGKDHECDVTKGPMLRSRVGSGDTKLEGTGPSTPPQSPSLGPTVGGGVALPSDPWVASTTVMAGTAVGSWSTVCVEGCVRIGTYTHTACMHV